MRKSASKVWMIVVISLLVLGGTAIGLLYNAVGADTIEANKGTKIQLVDESNQIVKKSMPIAINMTGTIRTCNRTSYGPVKVTKCRNGFKTIKFMNTTNANGEYTLSTQSYRPLTDDEIKAIAQDILNSAAGRPLTETELNTVLSSIIGSQGQSEEAVKLNITNSISSINKSKSSLLFTAITPMIIPLTALVSSKTIEKNFSMVYADVNAVSDIYKSDTIKVSFVTQDYVAAKNLLITLPKDIQIACNEFALDAATKSFDAAKLKFTEDLKILIPTITEEQSKDYGVVLDQYKEYFTTYLQNNNDEILSNIDDEISAKANEISKALKEGLVLYQVQN